MAKSIETDANIQSRFRVLWSFLVWEGGFRNARLAELLGVGTMQVSRIIAEFREQYPGAVVREKYEWIATSRARPPQGMGSLRDYLTLAPASGVEQTAVMDARLSFLEPNPSTFRTLLRAAKSKVAVSLDYASMTSGTVTPRVIYPQTLVQLGLRWHARAWCTVRREFRDFNLGRMSAMKLTPSGISADLPPDEDWNTVISVRLRAHSMLSPDQEKIVRGEYFGGTMGYRAEVRAALLRYWLQEARVAVDPKQQCPPNYILQLQEPRTVARYLFDSRTAI